jgi:hypothetical protein
MNPRGTLPVVCGISEMEKQAQIRILAIFIMTLAPIPYPLPYRVLLEATLKSRQGILQSQNPAVAEVAEVAEVMVEAEAEAVFSPLQLPGLVWQKK